MLVSHRNALVLAVFLTLFGVTGCKSGSTNTPNVVTSGPGTSGTTGTTGATVNPGPKQASADAEAEAPVPAPSNIQTGNYAGGRK